MTSRNPTGLLAALALALSAGPATAGVITATNNTIGLFDASSGTRSVTFTGVEPGFDSGTVQSVTIAVNFAKADGEAFPPPFPTGTPFHNEIVFRLTSPGGTTVTLIDAGSFNAGTVLFDGTITFDQAAAQVVNVNPNLPQAGTFRPVGNLTAFSGQGAAGMWTLFIQDTTGSDALRFRSFTLNVTTTGGGGGPGVVVPEPASLALLGLGVACGGVYRRLRRRPAA